MKLCIAISQTLFTYIEIDELSTVEDIKVLIQVQIGVITTSQQLYYNQKLLKDETPLLETGILENDFVQLVAPISQVKKEALGLMQAYLNNPNEIKMIEQHNAALANAIKTGNIYEVETIIQAAIEADIKKKQEKMNQEMNLDLDPLNPDAQKEIENRIQQKIINESFNYAQEYTPEVFASVHMLYIDCKVNGKPVQAFVDSGAQNTIMSKKCAEKLEIMRLVDTRFNGMAQGVGVDKILGRIHAINLEIGGNYFDCCFHILENSKIDMLFGLDMLKRHQCCIDLHKNVLTLRAGEISIPFLSEAVIKNAEDGEVKMEIDETKDNVKKVNEKKEEKKVEEPKKTEEKKVEVPKIEEKKVEPKKVEEPKKEVPQTGGQNNQWNQKLEKIVRLGFSNSEAEQALRMFQGNEEMAASYLFTKGNPFGF